MRICLDAGHGGKDPGAVASHGGVEVYEKELTLQYVVVAKAMLEAQGHEVFLTRAKDVFIFPAARLRLALSHGCDVFVSVHCNSASSPKAHGMEVLYRDEENDMLLAQCIYDMLLRMLGPVITGRGLKDDEMDLNRRLSVLNDFPLPACLVEVGFLSNEGDLHEIERVDAVAQGIADGIELYVSKRGGHV